MAAASRRLVILIGSEKLVPVLGAHGKLPVEIVPFGLALCKRSLAALGCQPHLREHDGAPFVTDNGNLILDCGIGPLRQPDELEARILAIPGVVGTGLFLNMRPTVLVPHGDTVQEKTYDAAS